ncbi:NAD(P)-binding protein [Staphylococcus arlettae]|uniref:NAD(P)-binding protein n=1 Tax=Staphylococcus arlettae TaxID=29378 RepID=UPI000D198EBB|nr:NAD(P)-binding protein [Staphylococcus arlettae]PTH48768.1 precorrin-2 dehydrogenase [Staphylococcus arlettae]PTH67315.1 precorrin-2 dehydrogenase [Staphylococcus arlettae]RIM74121.1 NAD(P)-binding protein [Staphylococcus arlettae]RIM82244.1 NAD(P)-binding protein [Staphylococcus arlettae]
MAYMPILLDLTNKSIVIIGGGAIAERRVNKLMQFDAYITVMSPTLTAKLQKLYEQQQIQWLAQDYSIHQLPPAALVVVATNNKAVNRMVKQELPQQTLLNMASDSEQGDVVFPGILKRGKLSISVSTSGASPKLTTAILAELQQQFPPDYEQYVDFLYTCRQQIKQSNISHAEQQKLLATVLDDKYQYKQFQQQLLSWLAENI